MASKYSASLSHDLFEIVLDRAKYYGGSQYFFKTGREQTCGCGIAGAVDVLLYREALQTGKFTFSTQDFLEMAENIRKYIPIIPGRGVNSFILASGLNRYFRKKGISLRAHWKITRHNKWEELENRLKKDIPVILAIGNNFPNVWGKKKLNLYVPDTKNKNPEEKVYKKQQGVNGHFVVVTAIEDNCLTVSSWGRKYFINIDEYDRYVAKHSIHLYSNILVIK